MSEKSESESESGYPCAQCGIPFDPARTRWLCPNCKHKNTCCEGAPAHA